MEGSAAHGELAGTDGKVLGWPAFIAEGAELSSGCWVFIGYWAEWKSQLDALKLWPDLQLIWSLVLSSDWLAGFAASVDVAHWVAAA